MTVPVRNLIGGVAMAGAIAIVLVDPTIAGVRVWKWLLALVGLLLWFLAGRRLPSRP